MVSPPCFVPVPDLVRFNRGIAHGAQLLCGVLERRARRYKSCSVTITQADLCREIGRTSDSTVRGWLKQLRTAGVITWRQRGQGLGNVYHLSYLIGVFPDRLTRLPNIAVPQVLADQDPQFSAVPLREEEQRDRERDIERSNALAPLPLSDQIPGDGRTHARRPAPRSYDPARAALLPYVTDIARELHDAAELHVSLSRAVNVFRRAGQPLDTFTDQMLAARAVTQERSASIKTVDQDGRKRRMPYWFEVLEDRLGLREKSGGCAHGEAGAGAIRRGWCKRDAEALPLSDTPPGQKTDHEAREEVAPWQALTPPTVPRWPEELVDMGLPDLPSFIRATGRGPFFDPAASVAFARKRLTAQTLRLSARQR